MSAWVRTGKRWLFLIHRWVGIASCLLLAMWFASGVVMIYVPYPSLTTAERLAGLAPIDWRAVRGIPRALLNGSQSDVTLEQTIGGPVWRIRDGRHEVALSARTGSRFAAPDGAHATLIAERFAHENARAIEPIVRDQWTVAGSFDRFRPLWKVTLDDPAGRIVYVSSTTAAVVQDSVGRERFWNWLGSVPHWLYPTLLRRDQPLWRQVVLWTSGVGIVGAVGGMWIGILRVRLRRRYKHGRMTPYRGWQWWHHVLGLVGGTILTTWIVSGWLSADPGRWFTSPGLPDAAIAAYTGRWTVPAVNWPALARMPVAKNVKRVRLVSVADRSLVVIEGLDAPAVLDAATLMPVSFDNRALVRRAALLMRGHHIQSVEWLTRSDNYWYEAKGSVELPMLRVTFDDPAATWVHVSPRTGEIMSVLDRRRRVYRWLYDGLHRWDFDGLITRRPLWDMWMWFWSIAGAIVSISGVLIGWRRLFGTRRSIHA